MFHDTQIPTSSAVSQTPLVAAATEPIYESTDATMERVDELLEREKRNNKADAWIKLDKPLRTQKLHHFSEKYGAENALSVKDIHDLKNFFITRLDNNKLGKTKDVIYDRETGEITSIPALIFNATNHQFALKITDPKRVSTIKSLTPKKSLV